MARYRGEGKTPLNDDRLFAPSFSRNGPPIIAALAPWLAGCTGAALEIGSGTGQHITAYALAFPGIDWRASDIAPIHRASITAWQVALGLRTQTPLDINAATDWAQHPDVLALSPLNLVLSQNVIHIAPFSVAQGIVNGAAHALMPGGMLMFYGPFRENGSHTGDGNITFDKSLRAENSAWGLRDTTDIIDLGTQVGLSMAALIAMPSNNRLLIFRKD